MSTPTETTSTPPAATDSPSPSPAPESTAPPPTTTTTTTTTAPEESSVPDIPGIKADHKLAQMLRKEVAEMLGRTSTGFPGAQP
ncbi:hypothetical protein P167DRAFT_577780, partial [Morchella conica CCBAS932]